MQVTLWGTRGSLASPGPDTVRYGGNTACVEVRGADGACLVLDAGTGIRRLGEAIGAETARVDVLLTHLHMDHLQGIGFFGPLYRPDVELHIWGPSSTTLDLRARLARYLSPPLFPVRVRDLPSRPIIHDVPLGRFAVGAFSVTAALVCHPGPTVGYRIVEDATGATLAYLTDHEPALGARTFPGEPAWTSGFALADGADLLIHDAQYTEPEYAARVGWGHSSFPQTLAFAGAAGVRRLVPFHHDPSHDDRMLDAMMDTALAGPVHPFELLAGAEGATYAVGQAAPAYDRRGMMPPG
jgi:phosphoribosyl 1,2-cyclic phosphodiesterase